MTKVTLKPNENPQQLFRRFKKSVIRSGLISSTRKKRWFIPKSEVRRMEKKKAIRRSKRLRRMNGKKL